MTIRIAMWSGPRNISTAMMRSWENRSDCSVVDEPFYAYYLHNTDLIHPMQDEVLKSQATDYQQVAFELSTGKVSTPIQYQKHMTQHMPVDCDLEWAANIRHCFLIRDPAMVVDSYTRSRGQCSAQDIGIKRQYELYKELSALSDSIIPVIDSSAVLTSPESALTQLCAQLSIPFEQAMLSWPKGRRESDGVWASHWYHSVEASTGFAQSDKPQRPPTLTPPQQKVVDEVQEYYQALKDLSLNSI